jgi:hypothetical protein
MNKLFIVAALLLLLAACGDHGDNPVDRSSIPGGLTAAGTLGHIALSWQPVSTAGLSGYNVYRSADGASFSLLKKVEGVSYDDAIASPGGDGIIYSYYVTAVADTESDPSATVRQMHGTRLPAVYEAAGQLNLEAPLSPYVLEGTSRIHKSLYVVDGAALYLMPGSTLAMITAPAPSPWLWLGCYGTLQSLGTAEHPVTITCENADGSDPVGQTGFTLLLDSAEPWDPVAGTGTMMRRTRVKNLHAFVDIETTAAYLDDCYFSAGPQDVAVFLVNGAGAAPIVSRCRFTNMPLDIRSDLRSSGFSFTLNRIRCPDYVSVVSFSLAVGQVLSPGQVSQNDLDGGKPIFIYSNTESVAIPLGGNYWAGGVPTVSRGTGVNASIDFGTKLDSAPAGAGPSW